MADNRFGTLVGEGGTATQLDQGLWIIDLGFKTREGVIGSFLLAGDDEVALIETGPATTLPALRAGIRAAGFAPADVSKVLVTHIHIDHAGASGVLARENPDLKVFVHPLGAPHLIDPTKLLISAGRIYGDRMEELWGEVPPVPADQVVPLADGETLSVAGRPIAAIFTPGHATHHVAFWNPDTGALFTGDAAGVRMPGTDLVAATVPPPDLDREAWIESTRRMQDLHPRRIYPTHFGAFDDAEAHLAQIIPNLDEALAVAKDVLESGAGNDELTRRLHELMASRLGDVPEDVLINLEWATPSYMSTLGLTRFLEKGPPRARG
ncbi:MAG TPA: MBL fold metallo-hydrolase [Thermomicrobiales bacterium]|nr:MBL fold metallo-hydrolase [Thermomicrobiales bacterium]